MKLRRYILFIFCLFIYQYASSQSFNNYWLLGYNGSVPSGPPFGGTDLVFSNDSLDSVVYHYRKMNFEQENASISDSSGNLLFYTNGIFVANALDDTMVNGSGLNPSQYTTIWTNWGLPIPQGALIIPFPEDTSKYYLFHETAVFNGTVYLPNELLYSIVDMSLDSSRGALILKNNVLLTATLIGGQITACKHANGRDWWLIVHQCGGNKFYKYLISPFGIQGPNQQNIGNIFLRGAGQAAFSPDGQWYARYNAYDGIDIFNFDRCTGLFTSSLHLAPPDSSYGGVAISANSNYLYVPSALHIYQYDLSAANIAASQQTVAVWDTFYSPNPPFATTFYLAGLAADGKIYVNSNNGVMHLHKINYPDSAGLSCDVQQHSIPLPTFNAFTMPNYPNYFLGRLIGSPCDTVWQGIEETDFYFKFRIYPNPVTSNSLHIGYLLPQNKAGIFSIYDITGKIVFKYNLPQWSNVQVFNLPKLSDGVYQCIIKSNNFIATKKLIVINEE